MMCQGILRMAMGLSQLGMISAPPAPFNSHRERYEQRFGCLRQLLRPEYLPYEEFAQASRLDGVAPEQLLLGAYESLMKVQSGIAALLQSPAGKSIREEQSKHLGGLGRIAAMNLMALKLLIQSITGPGAAAVPPFKASWDFKVALQHSDVLFYPCLHLKSDSKK